LHLISRKEKHRQIRSRKSRNPSDVSAFSMNFFLEISVFSSTLLSSLLAIKKNYQADFFPALSYPILSVFNLQREREREGKEEISISTDKKSPLRETSVH